MSNGKSSMVNVMKLADQRICYYIPVEQYDENGYIPSVVFENEPGHRPLRGNGATGRPWYWGKTYEEAKETCRKANKELGLTEVDVNKIIASSMFYAGRITDE
jgi:hypothetical protein